MTEKLLQYIWKLQYFNRSDLHTTNGEPLQILNPGQLNQNQGPDFLQCCIKMGGTTWVGNIEIHTRSSQWNSHKHNEDKNYSNVILHVVWQNDTGIFTPDEIPLLTLHDRVPKILLEKYQELMHNTAFVPCQNSVHTVHSLVWTAWKERLAVERLERRATGIRKLLQETNNHWEEVFWWMLARNFGITVNSEAFEAVARSTSINILAKHKNQIHQLECLLFGQAGMLQGKFTEPYPHMLAREYNFLQKKYRLTPVSYPMHFLRMRPQNFPTIRLAQLAQLIHQSTHLFSKIKETVNLNEVKKLLQVTANDYWHYHYKFDEVSSFQQKTLGKQMIDNIAINTAIPVIFAYGYVMGEEKYTRKALLWLQETAAEDNALTRKWQQLGIKSASGFDSQALTELTKEYCTYKNCLSCAVGTAILKKAKNN